MKISTLLLGLVCCLSAGFSRAQSTTSVRIRGTVADFKEPFFLITSTSSPRKDTVWVRPEGSFDKVLTNWPALMPVQLQGRNALFVTQWFAPGFDLTYTIPNEAKLAYRQWQQQFSVTGHGGVLNQFVITDRAATSYAALRGKKAADLPARLLAIKASSDSLWKAYFPSKKQRQLTKQLPVFAEFARIKENERELTWLRQWRNLSSDTAAIHAQLFTPAVFRRLQAVDNLKCYECLLTAELYVREKLAKRELLGNGFMYAQQLPEYQRLFPKPLADAMLLDILPEIVYNYEFEAAPTPNEIRTIINRYYPAQATVPKENLLNRLSKLEAIKQAEHDRLIIGAKAPDFQAVDSTGRTYSLADFKGKVVYIDLWGSWCGSCRSEMPFVKKFYEKYQSNPDVVFINMSLRDKEANWKRALRAERPAGLALWDKMGAVNKAYNAHFVPRYLLIGKHGELLDAYEPGPRLSEAATQAAIDHGLQATAE